MIAIKDMEMPNSCKDCPLTYLDTGDDTYFGANERRCIFDDSCIDGMNERDGDCPLKETVTCKDCKHWKDSDGVYRRGIGAESKCPINNSNVFEGTFYCADFERRE